jgi:hypothetical protein
MEDTAKENRAQFQQAVAWLEKDIYQLDQMVQTLSDYYDLKSVDIEQLNRFAKRTLISMLPALVDSIYIRISRLTEPAKRCGHENLTLGSLVHLLKACGNEPKANEANQQFQGLRTLTHNIREEHRNQKYAHVDFDVALQNKALPTVPLEELIAATEAIEGFMTFASGSGLHWKADTQGNLKSLSVSLKKYYEMRTEAAENFHSTKNTSP